MELPVTIPIQITVARKLELEGQVTLGHHPCGPSIGGVPNLMSIDSLVIENGLVNKNASSMGHQLKSTITMEEIQRRRVLEDEDVFWSEGLVLPDSRLQLASIGVEAP